MYAWDRTYSALKIFLDPEHMGLDTLNEPVSLYQRKNWPPHNTMYGKDNIYNAFNIFFDAENVGKDTLNWCMVPFLMEI